MGYNPTVTNANVAPDLQKRIGFTPEEQKRLVDLDYGYIAKNDQALKEWWDKVFKGLSSPADDMAAQRRQAALRRGGLVGPATIYVAIGLLVPLAILFRYSLNQFVPGKFMVDALTIENYVKFFTDIYYTGVLWRTVRVAFAPRRSAC